MCRGCRRASPFSSSPAIPITLVALLSRSTASAFFRPEWQGLNLSSKVGAAFICVFALPFVGFGLFAFATVIRQVIDGTADSKAWLGLIFAFVFTGAGPGLMSLVIFGSKILKKQQRAQAEHPAEPWLWREDWGQGRIKGSTRSGMTGAWIFAVLWNLVSAPILFFFRRRRRRSPLPTLA